MEKHVAVIRNLRNLLSHACLDEELERVHIGSIKRSMQELCQHAQAGETYARRNEKARLEAAARTEKVQAVSSATDEFEQEGQEAPHLFEPLKLLEAFAILDSVKEEQQQEYYHCCAILPCSDRESSLSDFISD